MGGFSQSHCCKEALRAGRAQGRGWQLRWDGFTGAPICKCPEEFELEWHRHADFCLVLLVSGLNGLNVLLPGSQTPHAMGPPSGQLPSLGVPCMVLPSSTLGPFPVLYSPTMAGPVSPAPGTVPNTGPGNFRLPGLGSTPHLLIGPAALVNSNSSTLPPADPQLQGPHSLNQSPVMPRPHHATQPASPVYEGHPGSVVKLQQVSPDVWFRLHRKAPGSGTGVPASHQHWFESPDCRAAALGDVLPASLTDPVTCLWSTKA